MTFGWLRQLASRSNDAKDGATFSPSLIRTLLSKGPLERTIPLARQDGVPLSLKLHPADSDSPQTGKAMMDAKSIVWREFIWSRDAQFDQCRWHSVRWRFYENGLICFDAQMSNAGAHANLGDMQGHRIELRDKKGFLVGVWAAGFYVHRGLPAMGFQANIVDDHIPLKLHFSEIDKEQSGFWFRK